MMLKEIVRHHNYKLDVIIVFLTVFLIREPRLTAASYFYGTHALNMMDYSYLANSPEVVGLNQVISPRIIFDFLLYLPMRFGFSYELTIYIWNIVADLLYSIGVLSLISSVNIKKRLPLAILFVLAIIRYPMISEAFGFHLYYDQQTPLTIAFAIEMIAMSKAIKGLWTEAFFVASIGALFHIHEGIYGGGIITILYLLYFLRTRSVKKHDLIGLLSWMGVVVALSLPTLITDSANISNEDFCSFYLQYVGHMSFFSGWHSNVLFLFSSLSICMLTYRYLGERSFLKASDIKITMFLLCFLMMLIIIFVDVYPLSIVNKLYPQKIFKYFSILFILQYFVYLDEIINNETFLVVLQRLLLAVGNLVAPIMVVITTISVCLGGNTRRQLNILLLMGTLCAYCLIAIYGDVHPLKYLALFAVLPFLFVDKKWSVETTIVSLASVVLLFVNCAYRYYNNWNNIFYSQNMDTEGNTRLFKEMKKLIPLGETYLTAPSLGSKIFTINVVSGVACYIWPGPPSTSTGTLENLNRFKRIKDWDLLSFDEKIGRAKELGINYILFQTSEMPSNAYRIIESEDFALVNVND